VALKKPSDIFNKKESSVVFESAEISSNITETYDRFRDNLDKVNLLSEQIEQLTQQLSEKMTKTDLENAMYSQLMVLDENFKSIQNQVKGLNKEDLKEFKVNISNLTEIVENLVKNEIPKYKKQVTKNEVRIGDKFDELKEVVEENIVGIREEIDGKVNDIAEVIDSNLEFFNNQLQETSSELKKTIDTYQKLSKIVESKVSVDGRIDSIDEEVDTFKKKVSSEVSNIKADVVINEQHIKNVDKYLQEHHHEIVELKEQVFSEIEKLPLGNLQENIERLEKKIDFIKETYSKIEPEVIVKEVIKEGLLNEPPNTKNSDPLTPLDQKFVTLDQLQEHYRLFINRIQQQLSTVGGGGETRLKYLDDIVGIATNSGAYDGKYLQWNSTTNSAEFVTVVGGGTQGLQGIQGTQGVQGLQGTEGTQGVQGIQGTQGVQGIQGIQGLQGTEGTQGVQGIQGTQGTQGVQGLQGSQGVQGLQGSQGVQGLQGSQGTQGVQGIQGIQGLSGFSVLGTNNSFTGINTFSSIFNSFDTRIQSVAEKTTLVNGNTANLVYSTGGGNIAICTNPSGDITLNVTGIPTDSTFDNYSLAFSVIVSNTGTARSCTAINLNGLSRTIKWFGGSLAAAISGVTTSNGYDSYSFTGINTVGSASTTANYIVLGSVNGSYR
jgi:hypothetical protein